MRQEDVQLVIRQRTTLECLDMAFLFAGRHWLGVIMTAAVGIAPIAIINHQLFKNPNFQGYLGYLLLTMECPWATMLLTLYLGQITFSRRFSTRRAARDLRKSLPAMFAFQFLVRGLCLAVVVFAPMVFVGMYYLNEIILLEQTSMNKAWARRSAMNTRALETIIPLRLIDLIVLFAGTAMLTSLLRALSALWEDQFQWQVGMLVTDLFQIDWQLQVAFWGVITYLTVFRFITYLDCRIRREGWDVELKLRAIADAYRQREAA